MKKIFAIVLTILTLVGMLCITAVAAEPANELPAPAEGTLLRVTAIKGDETVLVGDYTNFEDGWHKAIHEGLPRQTKITKYERIIVDFYADWTSADDGNFTDDAWDESNSEGFNNDTIEIPDDVKITINLNGHTIKRVLPESISDGEVMYIDEDADVIINNGTITGGKSTNGAGGIHIHDANVELNDVHIVGNVADDDDGGGIALYDGAELIMTRGSFTNNSIDGIYDNMFSDYYGGAIYIEESKAFFYSVEFKNNQNTSDPDYGAAIYADNSVVYLSKCTFDGNGVADKSNNIYATTSIVHAVDTTLTMEKVTFTNNGSYCLNLGIDNVFSSLILLDDSTFRLFGDSKFTNNAATFMINVKDDSNVYVEDTTFIDNNSFVMYSALQHYDDSYFKNCTFENNKVPNPESVFPNIYNWIYTFRVHGETLTFIDCKLSDSTYFDKDCIVFEDTDALDGRARRFGSIFGEGSLTMIVAFLSLIASGVAIFLVVYYNKKKAAPVAANGVAETETDDEE